MPTIADYSARKERLSLRFSGALDDALSVDLVAAQYGCDESTRFCVLDFTGVTRVAESGLMMLKGFCEGLSGNGVRIELIGAPPQLREAESIG